MNPSLPLTGNTPHAAQMPVRPRGGAGPVVAVDESTAEAKARTAWLGGTRGERALVDTLLTMVIVAIGVVAGLTAVFFGRH